jgi:hypothetical protein
MGLDGGIVLDKLATDLGFDYMSSARTVCKGPPSPLSTTGSRTGGAPHLELVVPLAGGVRDIVFHVDEHVRGSVVGGQVCLVSGQESHQRGGAEASPQSSAGYLLAQLQSSKHHQKVSAGM